jgi:hypothetical protein
LGNFFARLLRIGRKTPEQVANGSHNSADYRGVSIVPMPMACVEARRLRSFRYLLSQAPRLPLPQCPQRAGCTCAYRKFADRRTGDRRDIAASGRWYMGDDRRSTGGRRKTDHHLSRIEINWARKKTKD